MLDSARQEWQEGYRRLEAEEDRSLYAGLMAQVDTVRDELRRRVGQAFTMRDLDRAYREADTWIRPTVADPRSLALVVAAAFHLYARGATDYEP